MNIRRPEIVKLIAEMQLNSVSFWYNHPKECRIENHIARMNAKRRKFLAITNPKANVYIVN